MAEAEAEAAKYNKIALLIEELTDVLSKFRTLRGIMDHDEWKEIVETAVEDSM
jgi:hypothetical protein